jgi:hypothetical protein
MRTKPIMSSKLLRSVLVAAFSAVTALGVLSGLSGTNGDVSLVEGGHVSAVVSADGDTPNDSVWD